MLGHHVLLGIYGMMSTSAQYGIRNLVLIVCFCFIHLLCLIRQFPLPDDMYPVHLRVMSLCRCATDLSKG